MSYNPLGSPITFKCDSYFTYSVNIKSVHIERISLVLYD